MWATSKVGPWLTLGCQGGGKAERWVEPAFPVEGQPPARVSFSCRTSGCPASALARCTRKIGTWPLQWLPSAATMASVVWSSTRWHSCSRTAVTAWTWPPEKGGRVVVGLGLARDHGCFVHEKNLGWCLRVPAGGPGWVHTLLSHFLAWRHSPSPPRASASSSVKQGL